MTTIAQLRKIAKTSGFETEMKAIGFSMGPSGLWFYRERNGYIDFFEFWPSSTSNYVRIPVTILKRSIVKHCDMSTFPKGFNKQIPIYTDSGIDENDGVQIGMSSWSIKRDSDVLKMFSDLVNLFKNSVNTYFLNIDNDKKLYDSISIRCKESQTGIDLKNALFSQ